MDIIAPPKVIARKINLDVKKQGLAFGLHPIIAHILAARPLPEGFSLEQILSPKLSHLLAPQMMADMDHAAERVATAVIRGECIGLETDHDCDGQTSHAVLFYNLAQRFRHPNTHLRSYIGHRLKEGYGLSESVAARILADDPRPSLVITADNGSADEPRIAKLKAAGIDVIVTDHHAIPIEGCPESAFACLNPTRSDCGYEDTYIAGCMVAWLLMAVTRQKLIDQGFLPKETPNLSDSLDFVAVGTIADCVSMARSQNNRAVVTYGLRLIKAGTRPCWRALKREINAEIRSEDLGFRIAPLLNSDGRLASAFGSVSFLLAETDEEAFDWIRALKDQNEQRKAIQRDIVKQAMNIAAQQVTEGRYAICIFLPEGHSGVQGIAASRLKETFGRATAIFAPKQSSLLGSQDSSSSTTSSASMNLNENIIPGNESIIGSVNLYETLITGSVRGIEEIHVREALQWVADKHPNLLLAFGGHKGAGGLTLKLKDFDCFSKTFEEAIQYQFQHLENHSHMMLGPQILTDGSLATEYLTLDLLDELFKLEPFGREFEAPIFELEGLLTDLRPVGDGTHARVVLKVDGQSYAGIWFGMRQSAESPLPVTKGCQVKVAFSLRENFFQGRRKLDIQVVHLQQI